jgi:TRAP-type C4-dicarboxylate transport system permease large subunit
LKKLFIQRILLSILLMVLGFIQINLDTSEGFNFGYVMLFIGGIILLISIISYLKSRNNKILEKKMSKEYDERDILIDGKVSRFSMRFLMYVIIIIMFLTNFVVIPTNTALLIVLISLIISEFGSRKYYNHVL